MVLFRSKHGLKPKQVAMLLNVSEREYLAFESGKSDISAVQLLRLCEYYEVEISAFVTAHSATRKRVDSMEKSRVMSKPAAKAVLAKQPAKSRKKAKQGSFQRPDELAGATEEERFLNLMANIVTEIVLKEVEDERKLERFPDGFHYEEKKACVICSRVVSGEESWFDKHGLKCIPCQRALESGIIPFEAAQSKDSFYSAIELELDFGLKEKMLKLWKKDGTIRSRIIPNLDGKSAYFELFLLSDNEKFLPPHELLRIGGPVKEVNANGIEEVVFYPWYCFVDPIAHLKDYGISRYMRFEPLNGEEPEPSSGAQEDHNESL